MPHLKRNHARHSRAWLTTPALSWSPTTRKAYASFARQGYGFIRGTHTGSTRSMEPFRAIRKAWLHDPASMAILEGTVQAGFPPAFFIQDELGLYRSCDSLLGIDSVGPLCLRSPHRD